MAAKIEAIKSGIIPELPRLSEDLTLNLISSLDKSLGDVDIRGSWMSRHEEKAFEQGTILFLVASNLCFKFAELTEGRQLSKRDGWLVAVANAVKDGYVTTKVIKNFGFSERACEAGVKKGFLFPMYKLVDLRPRVYILSALYPIVDQYLRTVLSVVKFNLISKNQFITEGKPSISELIRHSERRKCDWDHFNKLLIMCTDRIVEGYGARVVPRILAEESLNFRASINDIFDSLINIKQAWHLLREKKMEEERFLEFFVNNIAFVEESLAIA